MPEEVNIPQNTDDPMPGTPTFADLEKLAEQAREAGDQLPVEDKDESGSQGLEPQAPVVPDKPAFQEKMQKHGFKSEDDLLRSYEEAHAKITKLSQSESETRKQLDYLAQNYNQALQVIQQRMGQGQGQPQGNEELFREVAPLVEQLVNQKVQGITDQITYKENMKAIQSKRSQNPDEFAELVPHMAEVIKEHPYLDKAEHLDAVYEKAKEKRDTNAMKLISVALGPNVDMDKVRRFFSKDPEGQGQPNQDDLKAAFIPASATGSRPMDTKPKDYASEIKKAQESGDIDKVIKLTVERDSFRTPAVARR